MKVWKGSVIYGNEDHKPGTILEVKKDCILVATGKDILSIEELQFSGRKKMSVNQYLVGNNIEPGIILGEQYGD
jgi:methionyl-tRNA formyltransferase